MTFKHLLGAYSGNLLDNLIDTSWHSQENLGTCISIFAIATSTIGENMTETELRAKSRMLNAISRAKRLGIIDGVTAEGNMSDILTQRSGWGSIQLPNCVKEEVKDLLAADNRPMWEKIHEAVRIWKMFSDLGKIDILNKKVTEHMDPKIPEINT